jgi:2,4-dienoyl-CoA reductase-like NADH-dependent reductase (Old Yellow Enzyme family)
MFTPFILNGQTIKNRIVRSATREYLFHPDGTVTDEFVAIYEELAKNEVGLLLCGCLINDDRYKGSDPAGSVDGEKYVPGLSRVAEAVHRYGSLVYGQIIYTGPVDFEHLTEEKIEEIARQYIKGAVTLKQAG